MTTARIILDGAELAVTGDWDRGQFRAVSVKQDGVELRPLLAATGRLRRVEWMVEWELLTAPEPV